MIVPPLNLVDGCFLIDNSGIEKLKCPRFYEYTELHHRVLADAKAGRNFGSGLHRGWEVRSKEFGTGPVTNISTVQAAMDEWFKANPQPLDDFRNYAHACRVMDAYLKHYPVENFSILANPKDGRPLVECTFALPFGQVFNTPIIYCGKIDLLIQDVNGIWVDDHKTTFQFGDTWEKQMQMDGGQLGYTWAGKQVLGPQAKVNGYIIDGVRIRRPNPRDNYDDDKAPVDKSDFRRIPHYVPDDALAEWQEDTLALITDIFTHHSRGFFPRHRWNCTNKFGICDMYHVCNVPRAARHQVLTSNLYEDNTWSPLKQLES